MNLKQAERTTRVVSLLNFITILINIILISIPLYYLPSWIGPLVCFMPWLFPRELAAGIVIVLILTAFVYFYRSWWAAILLLLGFILDRFISIIIVFSLVPLPQLCYIGWFCITIIWGLILINQIKAIFV